MAGLRGCLEVRPGHPAKPTWRSCHCSSWTASHHLRRDAALQARRQTQGLLSSSQECRHTQLGLVGLLALLDLCVTTKDLPQRQPSVWAAITYSKDFFPYLCLAFCARPRPFVRAPPGPLGALPLPAPPPLLPSALRPAKEAVWL